MNEDTSLKISTIQFFILLVTIFFWGATITILLPKKNHQKSLIQGLYWIVIDQRGIKSGKLIQLLSTEILL